MLYAPSSGVLPVEVIVWTKGEPLSTAFSFSVSRASETETPSFTSDAACLRLAAVMRLMAPIWSCLPHRPQLESSVIQRSTMAAVTEWPGWASAERPAAKIKAAAPHRPLSAIAYLLCLVMMAKECHLITQLSPRLWRSRCFPSSDLD